ncbi:MAG TPA: hypothetical protein VH475_24170 [Tepidisphaeraceae bacterium]
MNSPLTIRYATVPDPSEVRIERDAHHVEMIVPPVHGWRALPWIYVVSLGLLATLLVWQAAAILITPPGAWRGGDAIPNLAVFALLTAGVFAMAYVRLHRWLRLLVTADRVYLARRVGGSLREVTASWPRSLVLAAGVNPHNGRLALRILGQDVLEVYVSPDRARARRIAQMLDGALHETFEPLAPEGLGAST